MLQTFTSPTLGHLSPNWLAGFVLGLFFLRGGRGVANDITLDIDVPKLSDLQSMVKKN